MHLLKIAALLFLVLAAMRCLSWVILWALLRLSKRSSRTLSLMAAMLGLVAFSAFLVLDRIPGEVLDLRALGFGVAVFLGCHWLDQVWVPGFIGRKPNA